ncbi:MAG: hypothetical protein ABH986_06675 [archaeon]
MKPKMRWRTHTGHTIQMITRNGQIKTTKIEPVGLQNAHPVKRRLHASDATPELLLRLETTVKELRTSKNGRTKQALLKCLNQTMDYLAIPEEIRTRIYRMLPKN